MGRTKASYLVSHLLLCVFFVYISVAILFQSVHDLFLFYLHAILNHVFEKFFEKEDLFPLKYSGFTLICRCNYKWVGIAILDGRSTLFWVSSKHSPSVVFLNRYDCLTLSSSLLFSQFLSSGWVCDVSVPQKCLGLPFALPPTNSAVQVVKVLGHVQQ